MMQTNIKDLLDVMCAPALVCTGAGVVEMMNEPAAEWLGTTPTSAAGQTVEELLSAPDEALAEFLRRSLHNGHASYGGRICNISSGMRQMTMSCQAQRLQKPSSAGTLLLVFAHANTQECAELAGLNALNEVAIGLVHEVNQPLTAVSAYAHSCRRWLTSGKTDHPKLLPTMNKIIEQVHVTGQLINSLKGLARGHDDERRACDLNQLVREALALLALDPRAERCKVETHLEATPCPVVVSSVQIKIVLLNLLRNALDASLAYDAAKSRLSVTVTAEEESWVSATVSDSGAGITAQESEHLFQPFVTSKSDGLGLGLVISRCLATAHAGRIEFQPGAHHGASFQLRLPMAIGCQQ